MPPKRKRSKPNKTARLLFILLLVVAGVLLFIEESGREKHTQNFFDVFRHNKIPEITVPEIHHPSAELPKVAIVMDDLGPNKKLAARVLSLQNSITLSILPLQTYSKWIAEEGQRLGRDIIVHIPMEAERHLRLGEGGVYRWMDDHQIAQTVEDDIRSIPFAKGASNHMGSSFSKDARGMEVVMQVLKRHGFFFLDSLTTPETVGFSLAKADGLVTLERDVFLDNTEDVQDMEIQWKRLVHIAQKEGKAIILAHPKISSIEFLRKKLDANKDFAVVPLSELIP